jgi:hypothetical protein
VLRNCSGGWPARLRKREVGGYHFDVIDHDRLIASGAPEAMVCNHEVIEA